MNVLTSMMDDMDDSTVTFDPDDHAFVLAVTRRIVRAPEDAEDVTQEALLLAYRHRDAFRGASRYRTWLYRIAVTTALGFLRRQGRARFVPLGERPNAAAPSRSAETELENVERCELVSRALGELAPAYRDVLLARVDATEPEVAARLGISLATVKIRTHRARKRLRETLDRMEHGLEQGVAA